MIMDVFPINLHNISEKEIDISIIIYANFKKKIKINMKIVYDDSLV